MTTKSKIFQILLPTAIRVQLKDYLTFRRMILKAGQLREFKQGTVSRLVKLVIQIVFWSSVSFNLFAAISGTAIFFLFLVMGEPGAADDLILLAAAAPFLILLVRPECEGLMLLFRISTPVGTRVVTPGGAGGGG